MSIKLITKNLFNKLCKDKNYKKYIKEYDKSNTIDIDLAKKLIIDYRELLELFYKCNIFVYHYNCDDLDSNIKNYLFHNNKKLRLGDVVNIMEYYSTNRVRCKSLIKVIIDNELVNKNECMLLNQVYNRVDKEEII